MVSKAYSFVWGWEKGRLDALIYISKSYRDDYSVHRARLQ
jgi:hypothetical protein